ncbi:Alpha/Beta hydrolase protein, partial [Leptodontidium sp. 2 PMI_412]
VDLTYAKYQGQTLQNGVNQWLSIRFAAPPTGTLRSSAPQAPPAENSTQDATKLHPPSITPEIQSKKANRKAPSASQPTTKERMAEDCLFFAIYASLNATTDPKLPIMFFIQGGSFSSNSNGNFNGTGLVQASGMNMIVVRTNYQVRILGFIGGSLVDADGEGAVPNNGLNDSVYCSSTWVKQHATKFGGNPDHIVTRGDSSGGNAPDILLTANNGAGFPDLFVGAAAEIDRDGSLAKNINSTGCLNATDPIDCMRMMPIAEFQNKTAKDGWGPIIDGKILTAPYYQMIEQGKFQKIPVIYGKKHIRDTVGHSITPLKSKQCYSLPPTPIPKQHFLLQPHRLSSPRNSALCKGSGPQWQRDAATMTELKLTCVAAFFSDIYASGNVPANYHYRYNILDLTLADQGIFTPHTRELYAIWGPNNTDGGDPKCFKTPADSVGCKESISIVQSYWISFIRSLDPNTFRAAGAPLWEPWSIAVPKRIVFDNKDATMEVMGQGVGEVLLAGLGQRASCNGPVLPLSKAVNAGLREGQMLLPFANGTKADPTISVGVPVNGAVSSESETIKSGNWTVNNGNRNGTVTSGDGRGNSTGTAPNATFTGVAGRNGVENWGLSISVLVFAAFYFLL